PNRDLFVANIEIRVHRNINRPELLILRLDKLYQISCLIIERKCIIPSRGKEGKVDVQPYSYDFRVATCGRVGSGIATKPFASFAIPISGVRTAKTEENTGVLTM